MTNPCTDGRARHMAERLHRHRAEIGADETGKQNIMQDCRAMKLTIVSCPVQAMRACSEAKAM
ncbi:MAG: hypothetical protein U1F24_08265 [Alphaproteobacteria bacterium]